jgi:preprotein translocase subunit SecD
MDRSLKWRTISLILITIVSICILLPSFLPRGTLPSVLTEQWPMKWLFSNRMSWGLDLQGGVHLVYSIDLDKAVDDRASETKRDLEARFADEGTKGTVRTPAQPLGAVTVNLADGTKTAEVRKQIESDFGDTVTFLTCPPTEAANSVCFRVSSSYADGVKKAALTNAVTTIRERINEKGVAEPNVVEKGDDIIVELPGLDKEMIEETKGIIARTAKLEMKVVDDCTVYTPSGCTAANSTHDGSPYMTQLYRHLKPDRKDNSTEPEALRLDIKAMVDQWRPDEGGATHTDYYLYAPDRMERVPVEWAKKHTACLTKDTVPGADGLIECNVTGRQIIERYLFGDKLLKYVGLAEKDPKFKVPDDRQIGFEVIDPQPGATEQRTFWRTYFLERAVRLTGSAISNAMGSYDPNTNRPIVLLDFNRYGGRIFGDVTAAIVGMKFATILDDKVKSAPIINGAIRGGRASITMGGSDPITQERERDDLVAVLKTGSLPAPLREESASEVGPSLGLDAIEKTRFSFMLGIALVFLIMVAIYKWSGFIAVFAVTIFIVLTLAVMSLFGATLTLPGIAAIVLSVGMVVDGNILIYERIRDELLLGKSVRGAIDLGFSRAFSAILDGQLTTAAAGFVLLNYGSGPIKGFAVMLLVGCFTMIFVNMWVTRILFDWVVARKKNATMQTLSI